MPAICTEAQHCQTTVRIREEQPSIQTFGHPGTYVHCQLDGDEVAIVRVRTDICEPCGRENDRRSQWPRYQKEAFEKNLALVESVKELADKKGCTPGQLALAWVHAQVDLPYTRKSSHIFDLSACQSAVRSARCNC